MRRMSPLGSEYRQRMRTEPTDAQKTARIAMIRGHQRMQRLGTHRGEWNHLGSFPNAPAADDGDVSNDLAFDKETGAETWRRPEPNPDYQAAFNPAIKDLERLSIEEEKLEERLMALNADIAAKETAGTLNMEQGLEDEDVKEAASVYKQLDKVRKEMRELGNQVSSGIVTKTRVPVLSVKPTLGGTGLGIGIALLALYYFRTRPRPSGGPRYIGTKDRLSIFGNF